MTTKPSSAPWADEPFAMIPTPQKEKTEANGAHYSVTMAQEMAHVHNCLFRGLNSIVQQAPYVPDATSDRYKAQDVQDFLVYVDRWVFVVHHHHDVEETYIFPDIERVSGKPGLMSQLVHEHELVHGGLMKLSEYAKNTKPEAYRWEGEGGMKAVIDSFSKPMVDHLHAEIEFLQTLGDVDSAELKKLWKAGEEKAKAATNLSALRDGFPLVLGCADKTFEGRCDFPPLPGFLPYLIKYVFSVGVGAWRFLPCDYFGRPKELAFVPKA